MVLAKANDIKTQLMRPPLIDSVAFHTEHEPMFSF